MVISQEKNRIDFAISLSGKEANSGFTILTS